MQKNPLSICLTGASGWLGRSLLAASDMGEEKLEFSIFGRQESTVKVFAGKEFHVSKFDIEKVTNQDFDVFAPFAFLTRDKAVNQKDEDYVVANLRLISEAASVVRRGRVGSLLNISSGIVKSVSDLQKTDKTYSQYAELKRIQEEELANACSSIGIPFINCRVYSLTGVDMQEPVKYAIGDLLFQAFTKGFIELNSKSLVTRRYMDSRDLMSLLVNQVKAGESAHLESGGQKIDIIEMAEIIVKKFNLGKNPIRYKTDNPLPNNEYFSEKNHFELMANVSGYELIDLEGQINNVTTALKNLSLI